MDFQPEYRHDDIVIDQVCDWIAQKWTDSMIAFKLRETLDKELKQQTIKFVIKTARKRIVERYQISPEEFKGEHIAWLEFVMRGKSHSKDGAPAKMGDRLRAGESLAALLNLENVTNEDPAKQAKKIHAFLRAAEATVGQDANKKQDTSEEQNNGDELSKETDEQERSDGQDSKPSGYGEDKS